MSNLNITQTNETIAANSSLIKTTQNTQNVLLVDTLETIVETIELKQVNYNIGYKKALNIVAKTILGDLIEKTVNAKGKRVSKYNGTKELKRVVTVATTMLFRKMEIKSELLTLTQTENLVNYGSVNDVNAYSDKDDSVYQTEIVKYLKSIKTRTVTSKTFEKKEKLA